MLSNQWTVKDFYPIEYIPRGVRLTSYGGDAGDLPPDILQTFLDDVAAGTRRTHRPRLLHRTDRCGPHHHGGRHRHREDRRHHLKAPAELQTPVHPRSQHY